MSDEKISLSHTRTITADALENGLKEIESMQE